MNRLALRKALQWIKEINIDTFFNVSLNCIFFSKIQKTTFLLEPANSALTGM